MPDGDQGLAQSIYLANMYAQRGECKCTACRLLRQATDGMISQVLKTPSPAQGQMDMAALAKSMGGLGTTGEEVP